MSFLSTYNSLSVRDWQAQGNVFQNVNQTSVNSASFNLGVSRDSNYIGAFDTRCRTYTKNANNSLTLNANIQPNVTPSGTIIQPRAFDIADGNIFVIGDREYSNDKGVLQFRHYGNGAILYQVIGSANLQGIGAQIACAANANITAVLNENLTLGNANVQIFERSGNTWSVGNTITTSSLSAVIDLDSAGTTLIIGDSTVNEAKVYKSPSWTAANLTSNISVANTLYGSKVVINSDGNIAGVLASDATDVANAKGRIHIFKFDGNNWNETNIVYPVSYSPTFTYWTVSFDFSNDGSKLVVSSLAANNTTVPPLGIQIYDISVNNSIVTQTIGNSNTSDTLLGSNIFISSNGQVITTKVDNGATGNIVILVA